MTAWLEPIAVGLLVTSVVLAVKRSIWQYPIGIAATLVYTGVFWLANLYSSAALNVFFTGAQIYGWWFWLYGDDGKRPRITTQPLLHTAIACAAGLAAAVAGGLALDYYTDAALPLADSAIFGLSVVAQVLLGRKKLENWYVWGAVNLLSVGVYAAQALWATAALYAALFVNVFWALHEWRKEMASYKAAPS